MGRTNVFAKQVLSQLSYTPTVRATLILKHFRRFQNPFLPFSVITVPKLFQNPRLGELFAPRQQPSHWLGGCARGPEGGTTTSDNL